MAWDERGSCLNIFQTTNHDQISETFWKYEAKAMMRNGFDVRIGVVMASKERRSCLNIFRVRIVFAKPSGFDVRIGVVMGWEERGSCLNIFRTRNRGPILETFMKYETKAMLRDEIVRIALYLGNRMDLMLELESSWHGKSMDLVLTYSSRQIAIGSQKRSRNTNQKTCCSSE
ncbi:uncharacterized protein G2W53_041408 [Senna tora]|uniref:Uncharacterized protein n=1 Tax=Senna tora TaxID=362788 RepID=A0A834VYR6_9FABA|nr:uncharacterized protein G2W53_041408 [Senna tora]